MDVFASHYSANHPGREEGLLSSPLYNFKKSSFYFGGTERIELKKSP
jgi:hypothetical protein